MNKVLTEQEERYARTAYRKGYTIREIANVMYVSTGTINKIVKGIRRGNLPPLEAPVETAERLRMKIDRYRADRQKSK